MPKPTLLQTVFNQPSQRYYGYATPLPNQRKRPEFYSSMPELMRVYGNGSTSDGASFTTARTGLASSASVRGGGLDRGQSDRASARSEGRKVKVKGAKVKVVRVKAGAGESRKIRDVGETSRARLDGDLPAIPTAMPQPGKHAVRTSTRRGVETQERSGAEVDHEQGVMLRGSVARTPLPFGRGNPSESSRTDDCQDADNDDSGSDAGSTITATGRDDDETVYFTPLSSPSMLPALVAGVSNSDSNSNNASASGSDAVMTSLAANDNEKPPPPPPELDYFYHHHHYPHAARSQPQSSFPPLLPSPAPPPSPSLPCTMLATLSPSTTSLAASAVSTLTLSPDGSVFSHVSSSTRATSPAPPSDCAAIPRPPVCLSSSASLRTASTSPGSGAAIKPGASPSLAHRAATISHAGSRQFNADPHWARDVRWLVPPHSQRQLNSMPHRHQPRRPIPIPTSTSTSAHPPMDPIVASLVASSAPTPPPTKRPASQKHQPQLQIEHVAYRVEKRMSAVWEEDEDGTGNGLHSKTKPRQKPTTRVRTHTHTSSMLQARPPPRQRPPIITAQPPTSAADTASSDPSRTSSQSSSSSAASSSNKTYETVDLPTTLTVSAGATSPSGYTSLTLPRAAYTPAKSPTSLASSKLDITRSGLAQTTMSTVSIVKHGAARLSSTLKLPAGASVPSLRSTLSSRSSSLRRLSLSFKEPPSSSASSSSSISSSKSSPGNSTPAHVIDDLPNPLSFGSHTPPPSKVGAQQVLVQVWAVALDGVDARLVQEKASKTDGFGFVPGRSFVGRVVEAGYEVKGISKGEVVMGLLDVKKCGALAEFIVVDRRRLSRAPTANPPLSIEQLALLPLTALPAHRALRTLTIPSNRNGTYYRDEDGDEVYSPPPRSCSALVLLGHDGVGAAAVQMLTARGVRVTAQVPPEAGGGAEEQALKWGAEEVVVDEVVEAIRVLHEGEFDIVLDTVGGSEVREACKRVLGVNGQFTTFVGDATSAIPSAQNNFRSSLRSLSPFIRPNKDRKDIAYVWVAALAEVDTEGADTRDSLTDVAKLVEDGVVRPVVPLPTSSPVSFSFSAESRLTAGDERVVPFERGADVFGGGGKKSMLRSGGTAVVRIVDYYA